MDSISNALLKALEPAIKELVEREVERRMVSMTGLAAPASKSSKDQEKLVLNFRECHERFGISRKVWHSKIVNGELRGIPRTMRGGHTGYVVPARAAARVFAAGGDG